MSVRLQFGCTRLSEPKLRIVAARQRNWQFLVRRSKPSPPHRTQYRSPQGRLEKVRAERDARDQALRRRHEAAPAPMCKAITQETCDLDLRLARRRSATSATPPASRSEIGASFTARDVPRPLRYSAAEWSKKIRGLGTLGRPVEGPSMLAGGSRLKFGDKHKSCCRPLRRSLSALCHAVLLE